MTSYRTLFLSLAALALAGCSSTKEQPATPAMSPETAAMMEKMEKLAAPGPEHAMLAKATGHWENSYRMHMDQSSPWMEVQGTSDTMPILGGRYIQETMHFEMMGQPFEGISITGYDNQSKQYNSLWIDTMSTWWTTSTGTMAADGTLTFKGTMTDVAGTRPFRMVIRTTADSGHMEMYDTIPPTGTSEVLVMTVDSKKVSDKPKH